MVSNLALKHKATDETEITVSSGKKKKKTNLKRSYGCKQSLCLCSKVMVSDVEKLNFFWCSNRLRFYCFYLFLEAFCLFYFFFLKVLSLVKL